jgi:hypothetical protein
MVNSRLIAAAIGVAVAITPGVELLAQGRVKAAASTPPAPPRSVIQKLRSFLGVNPPVAVGGSRSGGRLSVCLLSPWPISSRPDSSGAVLVGIETPVLLAAEPLNEMRLEQDGRLLWQERASSTKAIEGLVQWPIKPLQPGEQLILKIRPRGASGGDFASYSLRAADSETLESNRLRIAGLGADSAAWYQEIESLSPQQAATALALISSPSAPAALRESLKCQTDSK